MQAALLVVHVLLSLSLIGLVLIQHGKGADAGAAFGSGASATVFGARGSGSFLTRLTTGLAIAFFATSLGLAFLSASDNMGQSVLDKVEAIQATQTPEPQQADLPVLSSDEDKVKSAINSVPQEAQSAEDGKADLPAMDEESLPEQ